MIATNETAGTTAPLPQASHNPREANVIPQNPTLSYSQGPTVIKKPKAATQQQYNLHQYYSGRSDNPPPEVRKEYNCLQVVQCNLHKCRAAWDTLVTNFPIKNNIIILSNEPYVNSDNLIPVVHRDLRHFVGSKDNDKPRAAISIHKNLEKHCWLMEDLSGPDTVTVKLTVNHKSYILSSIYMDSTYDLNNTLAMLGKIAGAARSSGLPLIIGSDTNCRHEMWGDKLSSARGETLLAYLSANALTWENSGTTPTFMNSRRQSSVIDLTITNAGGSELVNEWRVDPKETNSDHRYITFLIKNVKTNIIHKRNPSNTDWCLFNQHLTNSMMLTKLAQSEYSNTHLLDEATCSLFSILNEAYEIACPPTIISSITKKPPWLNSSVMSCRRAVHKRLNKARRTKRAEDWTQYRSELRSYKKVLADAKKTSWREFCGRTRSAPESSRVYKILKLMGKQPVSGKPIYHDIKNKILSNSAEESLKSLIKHHFNQDKPNAAAAQEAVCAVEESLIERIYSKERLNQVIEDLEPLKAPGCDGLQAILLKQSPSIIKIILNKIYRWSHRLQYIPSILRESKGVFIAKPGKTDYCHPKSYRTITLTSILLKVQEKLIQWHLEHDLCLGNTLSKRQFGFRRGCSTESALHKIVHKIERRIAMKGYVLGTFLDIEGAFDNVSFEAVKRALYSTRMDKSTANWIIAMVTNRHITLNYKDASKRIEATKGCPQGGVLSPFLWNVVLNSLLESSVADIPGYLQAFADDLVILTEGNDLEVIRDRTQKSINSINKWCKQAGLTLSSVKTKLVMFTWRRKWELPKPITVDNNPMELSQSAKLLGVHLDSKLKFNEHIRSITKKATSSLMQIKKAVGPTWGLQPKTCSWIYTAAIIPILTYASVVWINALQTKINRNQVTKVERLALVITTGAMPSTPTIALNMITDTPFITEYIQGEAAKGALRVQAMESWTKETPAEGVGIIKSHVTINNRYIKNLSIPVDNHDMTYKRLLLDHKYTIHINQREELPEILNNISDDAITCYTNGSYL